MLYESCHLIIQTSTWSRFRLEKIKEYVYPQLQGKSYGYTCSRPYWSGAGFISGKLCHQILQTNQIDLKDVKNIWSNFAVFREIFSKVKFKKIYQCLMENKSVFVLCEFFSGLWENNHSPHPRLY